ncbi:MAG: glycosyltransferase family 4 protein [Euryarchaeota archaeon]|nr:glycosyltransferase family 4 protein [Euryarchaeota archaeon]
MAGLKRVLHVGPVESRGGMQATIRHHLKHPPIGWKTESINTHVDGSVFAKISAWRHAKRELHKRLKNDPPDVVHIHTATSYSWWRKLRAVRMCIKAGVPTVLQIHAGNFHFFLLNAASAANEFFRLTSHHLVTPVALTPRHKREIGLDKLAVIGSPAPPVRKIDPATRDRNLMVLLARPSPIKGHRLAIAVAQELRTRGHEVNLHLSGVSSDHKWVNSLGPEKGIHARGWLSGEQKDELLTTAGLLLIPSNYEGMPVAAMEALSCGLPVVASPSCEGILGGGGIIVDDLEVIDWANAIEALLSNEADWLELSNQGPTAVEQQTPENLGKQWAELYEKSLTIAAAEGGQ